jgi:hypothetical protein
MNWRLILRSTGLDGGLGPVVGCLGERDGARGPGLGRARNLLEIRPRVSRSARLKRVIAWSKTKDESA